MSEYNYIITVKTENRLTDEEIVDIMYNFRARMMGYQTVCPKSLIGSDIRIAYDNSRIKKLQKIKKLLNKTI